MSAKPTRPMLAIAATSALLAAALPSHATTVAQPAQASAETAEHAAAGKAIATISVSPSEGGVLIVGGAMALADVDIRAEMIIDRRGSGGTMSTRQAGEFALTAGSSDEVASVGVSFQPGDVLEVTVVLTAGDEEIAKSTLTVGGR